jgi:gliding motility-associated-like protein
VVISVNSVNIPLIAADDYAEINEDEILYGESVLNNDTDDAENILTVNSTPVSNVTNGTLQLNTDGTFTYTPNPDFNGSDSFVYEVCNNENPQECDQATVYINVVPVNDIPVAVDDSFSGNQDEEIPGDVSLNDSGLGDSPVIFTIIDEALNGTAIMDEDGTFSYMPDADFAGNDSITYEVCDNNDDCAQAKILLTIIPKDDPIVEITVPEGFSPNNDGYNDRFEIPGLDAYPKNTVIIMNRWGNKVYEASPYLNEWDGTNMFGVSVGGSELPAGTYFYIIELGDDSKPVKGFIYLSR